MGRVAGGIFPKGAAGGKQPATPGSDVTNTQQSVHSKASGLTGIVSQAGMDQVAGKSSDAE